MPDPVRHRLRVCANCLAALTQPATGRPRRYCSPACRQSAYASRRRRPTRRDEWWTPPEIREQVLARWPLTLDAAACGNNTLVPSYLGPDHPDPARRDALVFEHWADLAGDGVVWLNPPYVPTAALSSFLGRAVATARAGVSVVGLLPASTGAHWWWEHVIEAGAAVEFLRGRLSFHGPHARTDGASAPWPSALVLWSG